MKISHRNLIGLIRECMMEVELDANGMPGISDTMPKISKCSACARKERMHHHDHMHQHSSKGRMLDYGNTMSDSHEGRMTKTNLYNIARMASELDEMLYDEDDLPEWLQDKIATVKDRLESCYSYLKHELEDHD